MIERIIHRLLLRRHFWRYVTLGEVAELYAARLLRMTALSLISVMVAIYLYKSGYSVIFIAAAYAVYFTFKVLISYPGALVIARFGPKHSMFFANIAMIPSLMFFLALPNGDIWMLVGHMVFHGISICLYDMAHLVSFSKIKSTKYAGRELGFMNIVDKLAKGMSPFLGGLIAWLLGPEVTIWFASALFLASAIPLFRSAEPVRVRQKINFRGFPWKHAWRSFVAEAAIGVDNAGTGTLWQLFLVSAVLTGSGDKTYAEMGALVSVTLVVGLIIPRVYGRIVDRRRGLDLLRYGVAANSIVHMARPLVNTPVAAGMTNVAYETSTTAYAMAFMRGIFDLADRSGHRIAYLLIIEVMLNLGTALMFAIAVVLMAVLGETPGLHMSFVIIGMITLLISSAKFPLYRR
ncbi:MFS transporter [Candidatus Saccharibacteria bacterium]|jgi:hypothetical protein|nr:MFS transporter [Candidatus Saccharibacteria bacterium]